MFRKVCNVAVKYEIILNNLHEKCDRICDLYFIFRLF